MISKIQNSDIAFKALKIKNSEGTRTTLNILNRYGALDKFAQKCEQIHNISNTKNTDVIIFSPKVTDYSNYSLIAYVGKKLEDRIIIQQPLKGSRLNRSSEVYNSMNKFFEKVTSAVLKEKAPSNNAIDDIFEKFS